MSIGLDRNLVKLESYDKNWPSEFCKEKALLKSVFGDKILAIEHIGSTSVPGLAAKPIIDMIAAVESFDELELFIKPLEELGYEYMPERMFADRKFFPKGAPSKRTHHLNLVLQNDYNQWQKPVAFRDYLIKHKNVKNEYEKLKLLLAGRHANSRAEYTAAKGDFIQNILRKAL